MLDLYRFNNSDLEDVKLADRTKYATLDEGQWIHPLGNGADTWDVLASATPETDASTNVAAMLFMEKNRTDSRAVGKMTVVRGHEVRGKTDVFIAADAAAMLVGVALTLKKDTDDVVKLGVAGVGDVVKAHVYMKPANDPLGLLHFQFA